MKFRCVTEQYRHFRGLLFQNGRATEVTDQATIDALEKHPEFEKVNDEKEIKEAPQEVLTDACPKCGKIVKRGKYMHQKWCGK